MQISFSDMIHNVFSIILFLLCFASIVYYYQTIKAGNCFFSLNSQTVCDHSPVSILKPICGVDDNTYEALSSFCQQDYPEFQIIFGVRDFCDPCIPVLKQIIHDFPDVEIDIVISDIEVGVNPKVNNLANALSKAKHHLLVLADSDICVTSNYLKQVTQPFHDPKVGVVTCLYRSIAQGWVSEFEALGIATEFLPSVLTARMLEGMSFALGATIVIRRSVLQEIGGFTAIADVIQDDFQLGYLPSQAGYQVVLSDYVVEHQMPATRFSELIHRQIRWLRGIRFARSWGHLGLIFTYGTVNSLLFLVATGGELLGWFILITTWVMRWYIAWLVGIQHLQDNAVKKRLWLVPLRDCLSFGLWCYSFIGNTIEWRNQRFRLDRQGSLVAVTQSSVLQPR